MATPALAVLGYIRSGNPSRLASDQAQFLIPHWFFFFFQQNIYLKKANWCKSKLLALSIDSLNLRVRPLQLRNCFSYLMTDQYDEEHGKRGRKEEGERRVSSPSPT